MKKFIKKNWTKFVISMSIFLACLCGLFGLSKSYAFTINDEGNLVSDNLFGNLNSSNGFSMSNLTNGVTFTISVNSDSSHIFKCSFLPGSATAIFEYTGLSYTFTKTNDMNNYYLYVIERVNYSTISDNVMLNVGSTALSYEPFGIWYSESNYNNIENDYNDLQDRYNELNDLNNSLLNSTYPFLIDNLTLSATLNNTAIVWSDWVPIEFKGNLFQINFRDLDFSGLSSYNTNGTNDLVVSGSLNGTASIVQYEAKSYFSDFNDSYFAVAFYLDNERQFMTIDLDSDMGEGSNTYIETAKITFNNFKIFCHYNGNEALYNDVSYFATGGTYAQGYTDGFNSANNINGQTISDLNNEISNLNNRINTMEQSINNLKDINASLNEQIESNLGWKSLFFAIADTPFKTISNVLGFDLFGINLFTTFIGMITVFAIVWLLRKFI